MARRCSPLPYFFGLGVLACCLYSVMYCSLTQPEQTRIRRDPTAPPTCRELRLVTTHEDPKSCRTHVCSENSDCFLGKCVCHPQFFGERCEFQTRPCRPNDARCMFFSEKYGTTRSMNWNRAQAWELDIWMKSTVQGDRWEQHKRWFANYSTLRGVELGNVLEIGSGPYTQSMYIVDELGSGTLKSLTLVDPLLDQYLLKVKDVRYRDFAGYPVHLVRAGAEDADFLLRDGAYDVVVMINVVEHCRNAWSVFQTLWNKLRPGGILVFNEYTYNHRDYFVQEGHEIKLRAGALRALLDQFQPLYERVYDREGDYREYAGIYFIGRKPTESLVSS